MKFLQPIIFMLLAFFGSATYAQTAFTLTAKVVDSAGEGVPLAVVRLIAEGEVIAQEVTALNGSVRLTPHTSNPTPQTLTLTIEAYNFQPYEQTIHRYSTPQDLSTDLGTIRLSEAITALEGVTLTGEKRPSAVRVEAGKVIFNPQQSLTTAGSSALEILKKTPAVTVDNQSGISIIGKRGTLVLLNDKPTYMQAEELKSFLQSLPASRVASIEVMPTPPASYDAQGAAGVINIVLKQSSLEGTYLSVGNGVAYGTHLHQNTDIYFQQSTEKASIYGSYGHQVGHFGSRYGNKRTQSEGGHIGGQQFIYNADSEDTDKRSSIAGSLGGEYRFTTQHTLGFNASLNSLFGRGDIFTYTDKLSNTGSLLKRTYSYSDALHQKANQYSSALQYLYKPSDKAQYQFDADYIFFDGFTDNALSNYDVNLTNGSHSLTDGQRVLNHRNIHIFALQAGQTFALFGGEMQTGAKYSRVQSRNGLDYFTGIPVANTLDADASNAFTYREQISAIYGSYEHNFGAWRLAAGLRIEHTDTDGQLTPHIGSTLTPEHHTHHYTDFFPTATLDYAFTDEQHWSLAYSSRIERPAYEMLNPVEFFLDNYSKWKGNPFLSPQKIHKLSLSAPLGKTQCALSYTLANDYYAQIAESGTGGLLTYIHRNIGQQQHLSLTLFREFTFAPWWKASANAAIFYIDNQLREDLFVGALRQWSVMGAMQHYFTLSWGIRAEVSGEYNSRRLTQVGEFALPSGSVDVGLQRDCWHDRLSVSLTLSDLFHTNRWDNESRLRDTHIAAYGNMESRQLKLQAVYKFGKQRERSVEILEVEERERL